MATDQQQRSEDKHGGATTELVETVPQRRSQHQRADREPPQQVGSRLGRDAEIALQHVGAETLEGENSRIIEHAEQSYDPEQAGAEQSANIAELELLLGRGLSGSHTGLPVESTVHDRKHYETYQTDEQQHGAESHRNHYRRIASERLRKTWREREYGKHAQTRQSHLAAHGQSHLLAVKPACDRLADRNTGHLAAAAEYHETESGQLGRTGHRSPPRREPSVKSRSHKQRANGIEFDDCTAHHERCREGAGETHTHLVEDYTGHYKEAEHIEHILRTGIVAECRRTPAKPHFEQLLKRRHHIDKHIGEEHHRRDQRQRSPSRPCLVVENLSYFFHFLTNSLIVLLF